MKKEVELLAWHHTGVGNGTIDSQLGWPKTDTSPIAVGGAE